MTEDIRVDRTQKNDSHVFLIQDLLETRICIEYESRTLFLNYSDILKKGEQYSTLRAPHDDFFPEYLEEMLLGMTKSVSIYDVILNFAFLHEDIHVVVHHLLKDDITRDQLWHVHQSVVNSAECFAMLYSLIGYVSNDKEMWEVASKLRKSILLLKAEGKA